MYMELTRNVEISLYDLTTEYLCLILVHINYAMPIKIIAIYTKRKSMITQSQNLNQLHLKSIDLIDNIPLSQT